MSVPSYAKVAANCSNFLNASFILVERTLCHFNGKLLLQKCSFTNVHSLVGFLVQPVLSPSLRERERERFVWHAETQKVARCPLGQYPAFILGRDPVLAPLWPLFYFDDEHAWQEGPVSKHQKLYSLWTQRFIQTSSLTKHFGWRRSNIITGPCSGRNCPMITHSHIKAHVAEGCRQVHLDAWKSYHRRGSPVPGGQVEFRGQADEKDGWPRQSGWHSTDAGGVLCSEDPRCAGTDIEVAQHGRCVAQHGTCVAQQGRCTDLDRQTPEGVCMLSHVMM